LDDNRNRKFCRELLARVRQTKSSSNLKMKMERTLAELQAAHDKRIEEIKSHYLAGALTSMEVPPRPDGRPLKLGVIFSGGNVNHSSLPF
jgi:hypothetical protein